MIVLIAAQVLTRESETGRPRKDARAVAEARRIAGHPEVVLGADHGAGELGVVGPRSEVQVVGSHRHPHVVDDAHLGVHVDRCAGIVLEVVHGDAVAAGASQQPDRALAGEVADGAVTRPSRSGNRGTTTTTRRSGARRSAVARAAAAADDQKY